MEWESDLALGSTMPLTQALSMLVLGRKVTVFQGLEGFISCQRILIGVVSDRDFNTGQHIRAFRMSTTISLSWVELRARNTAERRRRPIQP